MLQHVWQSPHSNTSRSVLHILINRLQHLVGNVENTCIQESSRPSTAANRSWICNPRGRGIEFTHSSFYVLHPLHLSNSNSPCLQQQDGPEPMTSTGEPFHFLPTAPDILFCKRSPPMKKVIMTVQPDLLQSASKRRQTSASVAPRVLTKKRKMITRRVIKKPVPSSPSPSESNTNQVTHHSRTFLYFIHMYLGWL